MQEPRIITKAEQVGSRVKLIFLALWAITGVFASGTSAFIVSTLIVCAWMSIGLVGSLVLVLLRRRGYFDPDDWWEHPEVKRTHRQLRDIEVGIEGDPRYDREPEGIHTIGADDIPLCITETRLRGSKQ